MISVLVLRHEQLYMGAQEIKKRACYDRQVFILGMHDVPVTFDRKPLYIEHG